MCIRVQEISVGDLFYFLIDLLHARLKSHYKAWSYKKKKHKKIKANLFRRKSTGNLFRRNLQLIGVC